MKISLTALSIWLLLALCAPAWGQDPGARRALMIAQQPQDGGALSLGAAVELLSTLDELALPQQEAALQKALQGRLHPLARALLERRRALLLLSQGKRDEARALTARQGFVTSWQILGPLPNDSGDALDRPMEPEIALQLDQEVPGRHLPLRWRPLHGADFLGVIDMEALIRPSEGAAAYAVTVLRSPRDQDVTLRVGADAPYQLWLGPHRVASVADDVGGDIDRDAWGVRLRRGDNLLLIKLANQQDLFTWSLRVTDARGEPIKDLQTVHDAAAIQAAAPPPGDAEAPAFTDQPPPGLIAAKAPLQLLQEAAEAIPEARPTQRALALAQVAALARLHRPRDTNEPWLDLLQRARALSPDARVLWLASRAYDQQWQRLDALEEAAQQAPGDPWLRLQRARALYDSAGDVHITQTLRELDALLKEHPDFVAPRLLKIQLLQDEGLTQAAFALAWETSQRHPDHPDALRVAFAGAEEAGWPDRLLDLCQQQLRWDAARVSLYGPCATAMLKRGKPEQARALLQEALLTRPDITGFWGLVADLELALGNPAGAEQALRQMAALLPDDPQTWARLGRHLSEHGDPDKAAEALSHALSLEPQNAEIQEYLAFLKPGASPLEDEFVLSPAPLSAEEEQARYANEDYFYLVDQQLTRVFPNGLSSRFVQQIARVRTDNGVSSLRNLQIAYTPGEERVDILKVRITRPDGTLREVYSVYEQSLSEPWYNLYYDYRAMIISLPDLGRGDTVELQYKLTQISARNALGDYFGDVWFAQEGAPKELARYTLLLPPERQIQARQPALSGCAADTQERPARDGEPALKAYSWTCQRVPGVKNEPERPGFSEVADYLHLSTWADWGALARWYWDLIEDQLVVDAELRKIVSDLTADLTDPRQKVSAVHNYVVQNTRYVGLEFGIHGFKPYRTTQCLRRRFGDCKDKASLLKVMLQEAGIEADLVLIRTRNNGAIDPQPPSLQIFDHAITYVPAFDLFLDGTAEYSGTRELPWGDQGAQVLIVKNGGAFRVGQTPILAPSHNAVLTSARVDLQPDQPLIDASQTITGDFAAGYRRAYETEQSRLEVFTRQLSQDHPGARVEHLNFSDLTRLEDDVRVSWRAAAPALAQRDAHSLRVLPALRPPRLQQRLAPWTRRELPLELGHPYTTQETYDLLLPRGAQPQAAPSDVQLDAPFGTFSLRYKWTPQTPQEPPALRVEVTLELKRHTIAPDEYVALRQWLGQIDQTLGTALVFDRK